MHRTRSLLLTRPLHRLCPWNQGSETAAEPSLSHIDRLHPLWGRSRRRPPAPDRKSTRLNSSHLVISYAVFCLKKKTNNSEILDLTYSYLASLAVCRIIL